MQRASPFRWAKPAMAEVWRQAEHYMCMSLLSLCSESRRSWACYGDLYTTESISALFTVVVSVPTHVHVRVNVSTVTIFPKCSNTGKAVRPSYCRFIRFEASRTILSFVSWASCPYKFPQFAGAITKSPEGENTATGKTFCFRCGTKPSSHWVL